MHTESIYLVSTRSSLSLIALSCQLAARLGSDRIGFIGLAACDFFHLRALPLLKF